MNEYDRKDKTSRDYPRRKQERPAGAPTINQATANEWKLIKQLTSEKQRTQKG